MAEDTKDGKIELSEIPMKIISSVGYKIKVPNFFTLPEYNGNKSEQESSAFEFANAAWCFRFTTLEKRKTKMDDSFKRFGVYLVMLNYEEVEDPLIYFRISLMGSDDEPYSYCCDVCDFDDKIALLVKFDNKEPDYDIRDTLNMEVHLICAELPDVEAGQVSVTIDRNTSLSEDFKDVFLNGQDHNLTFTVRDKKIPAHRDILRARSEVFRSMLNHDMLEKNSGVVDVPDCDPEAFEQLVLYLYTGKLDKLDEDDMFDLYYVADKYNIADLEEKCRKFIKKSLSVTNVCEAVEFASKHSDQDLLNYAINYFTENANDIFLTVEWQLFMKENSTVANDLIIKSFDKLKVTES